MSEVNQNQTAGVMPTETLEQGRDVPTKEVDKVEAQQVDDKISQLKKEAEETRKELEKARKRISEINEDDKSKRLKIGELEDTIKTKEERDALLQKEIETLRQQISEKEKSDQELKTLKTELESLKEQQQNAKAEALKQEEDKKAELIKQAEMASKKQNDPDILKLVEGANDNATRELILNKLKNKKVDTVKVTELSSFGNTAEKNISLSSSLSDMAKLKEENPEGYEDIISKTAERLGIKIEE